MKPCKFEKKKTHWLTMSYDSEPQRERRGVYASFCTALSCLQRRYFFLILSIDNMNELI